MLYYKLFVINIFLWRSGNLFYCVVIFAGDWIHILFNMILQQRLYLQCLCFFSMALHPNQYMIATGQMHGKEPEHSVSVIVL